MVAKPRSADPYPQAGKRLKKDGTIDRRAFNNGANWKQTPDDLTQRRVEYAEWLALSPALREPPTKRAYADQIGMTEQTLRTWERMPVVINTVQNRMVETFKVQWIPEVLGALMVHARDTESKKQIPATRVLMQHMQWMLTQMEGVTLDLKELSVTELKRLVAELYDDLEEREHPKAIEAKASDG